MVGEAVDSIAGPNIKRVRDTGQQVVRIYCYAPHANYDSLERIQQYSTSLSRSSGRHQLASPRLIGLRAEV